MQSNYYKKLWTFRFIIYPWRDIMHYSRISNGNNNRSNFSIQNYYNILLNFY